MDNTIGQRGPVMRPRHVATFIVTNVIPVGFIMFSIYNTKVYILKPFCYVFYIPLNS